MTERERLEKLNQLFFDYTAYLVFMARQIIAPGTYGYFALVKALQKVLEIKDFSGEIADDDFYGKIRGELNSFGGASSAEVDKWRPLLDRLVILYVRKMKENIFKGENSK